MPKGYATMALVFVILTPVELLFSRDRQPLGTRTLGTGFWVAAIPVTALFTTALAWLWAIWEITAPFGSQTAAVSTERI